MKKCQMMFSGCFSLIIKYLFCILNVRMSNDTHMFQFLIPSHLGGDTEPYVNFHVEYYP